MFLVFSFSSFLSFTLYYFSFRREREAIIRFHGLDMSNPSDRPWSEEDKVWILYPNVNLMLTKTVHSTHRDPQESWNSFQLSSTHD